MRIITEREFAWTLKQALDNLPPGIGSVTGPGRSGAIAAVYASHWQGVPFIPYGAIAPAHLGRLLVVDTAQQTGATIRKAVRRYAYADPHALTIYNEPPRVVFWYEGPNLSRIAASESAKDTL
jgi:hypothetical protein